MSRSLGLGSRGASKVRSAPGLGTDTTILADGPAKGRMGAG
ncbi:hypothetical protein ACH47Z_40990 [Streptomyces sp. NPDC020192]